jgi:hypothetical protein
MGKIKDKSKTDKKLCLKDLNKCFIDSKWIIQNFSLHLELCKVKCWGKIFAKP